VAPRARKVPASSRRPSTLAPSARGLTGWSTNRRDR
jgi:hypothetical protein